MAGKKGLPLLRKYGTKILVIGFWLFIWEIISSFLGQELLLASPVAVIKTLLVLMGQFYFWKTTISSFVRIILGFLLALGVGTILAIVSARSRIFKELVQPLMKAVKSMPVASFIFLALFWIRAKNVSVLISFLMVLPVIYTNLEQGLESANLKLVEMAQVFRINRWKKIRAIYIPAVMPYFISAVSVGLGFCWKAGIAAEAMGTPAGSIGEKLYEAKLYLMSDELFAWTLVIIVVSSVFEKAVLFFLEPLRRKYQG